MAKKAKKQTGTGQLSLSFDGPPFDAHKAVTPEQAKIWSTLTHAVVRGHLDSSLANKLMQNKHKIPIDFKAVKSWRPQIRSIERN